MSYAHASSMHQAIWGRRLSDEPDEPFDHGDRVVDLRDRQVGTVNALTYHPGYADRLDEPGECEWWEVEVFWEDGDRDYVDAEFLELFEPDEDAEISLTVGQEQRNG
jgi:hypothetical protein